MLYSIITNFASVTIYRNLRDTGQMRKIQEINYGKQIETSNNPKTVFHSRMVPTIEDLGKLDLLIFDKEQSYLHEDINFHCYRNLFPSCSFMILDNDVLICSPELTFCMLANICPVEHVMMYGLEMCGTYSMPIIEGADFNNELTPITNSRKIIKYVKNLENSYLRFKGIRKAKYASGMLRDFSASPRESMLYILLCIARKFGGFAVDGIELNQPIRLTKGAAKICGQKTIIPDLSIKKKKIAIEYDSNQFHDNSRQNIIDKSRLNALAHDGWKTFNFVPGMFENTDAMFHIAKDILKANSQESRIRTKNFYSKYIELVDSLKEAK